jgi:large subunit ribosomal protein L4e
MQLTILDAKNKEKGKKQLPMQFDEPVRPDLIQRAFLAIQSHNRQPYGPSKDAGKRHSVRISKRRRDWRGSYGIGISRVPRKIMLHRGTRFTWTGAFIPGTVGGRRAHPPKPERDWNQKINKKERRKAIRSAMAATCDVDFVSKKHKLPSNYPIILASEYENLSKTKDVDAALRTLGFAQELDRASKRKTRAGKGKARGRKYRKKKGPLLVVSRECPLLKAAKNIEGVDVVDIEHINVELLAPGAHAGRCALFTEAALDTLKEKKLFM